MKKLLLFGAGKIGRSFIAQIFSNEGYEIVFVDIDEEIISQLNNKSRYPVYIKDKKEKVIWVKHVRGLLLSQRQEISHEISQTNLIATCVGKAGLAGICPILAKGIQKKYIRFPQLKTDIIIAENMRGADQFMIDEIKKSLTYNLPLEDIIGIQETSIGKMVPIIPEHMHSKNPLAVYAEAYNTLIVSDKFLNEFPQVKALSPKSNIKAWVDRKLFIHNLGHCVAAYVGNYFYPERIYIYEVLEDVKVEKFVKEAMQEAALILQSMYPGEFSDKDLLDHINDLIGRFKNIALADTVYRVGCDLERKLSYEDRLILPIRNAIINKLEFSKILFAYFCALQFSSKNELGKSLPKDLVVIGDYNKNGIEYILQKYSGLNPNDSQNIRNKLDELYPNMRIDKHDKNIKPNFL